MGDKRRLVDAERNQRRVTIEVAKCGGNRLADLNTLTVNGSLSKFQGTTVSGLADLSISGSVGQLSMNMSNGFIHLGSAGKVTLGAINDTTLTATGGISSLTANSWTGTNVNDLVAGSIGILTSKGEFDPTLNIHVPGLAIKSARIGGAVNNSQWAVHGNVGSIQINGCASNAGIFAGTDLGASNARGGGDDLFDAVFIYSLVIVGNVTNALMVRASTPTPMDL